MVGAGGDRWQWAASCSLGVHPSQTMVSRCALSARLAAGVCLGGGEGRQGGGGPTTRTWLRPARGTTAAPWRLGSIPSRHRPIPEWGPLPQPGRDPPPPREGPRAITSPRGAVLGRWRIDTLLPH